MTVDIAAQPAARGPAGRARTARRCQRRPRRAVGKPHRHAVVCGAEAVAHRRDVDTASVLAPLCDLTLLRADATRCDVSRLCSAAVALRCAAVCVSPWMLPLVELDGTEVRVCTVVSFPHGDDPPEIKAARAAEAALLGAHELDMVADLAALSRGELRKVRDDIAAVRDACPGLALKVIVESAALTPTQLDAAAAAAIDAGADFLKTSTGVHPRGGATVAAVRRLAERARRARRPVGVKASGGIRTAEQALALVNAGATRLGVSSIEVAAHGSVPFTPTLAP